MSETIYQGEAYNKKGIFNKALRYSFITCFAFLIIILIVSQFSNERFNDSQSLKMLTYLLLIPTAVLAITHLIRRVQFYGKTPTTFDLTFTNDSIVTKNNIIAFKNILEIRLILTDVSKNEYFFGNNYLLIKTESEQYEFGLVLRESKSIKQIESLVKHLKNKKIEIDYDRRVYFTAP